MHDTNINIAKETPRFQSVCRFAGPHFLSSALPALHMHIHIHVGTDIDVLYQLQQK